MERELPTNWRRHRLGDLVEVFDGPHATPRIVDEGPVFLGIQALQNGRLSLANTRHVTELDFAKWTRRVEPRAGDVVFSYETRLGEAAVIPPGLRCCLGRRMGLLRIRPGAPVTTRMLLFAYLGPQFQSELRHNTINGSTVDRLPINRFSDFSIVLPPMLEQHAVAATLGVLDERIESDRRVADAEDATWLSEARAAFARATPTAVSSLIARGVLIVNDGYRAKNSELAEHGVPFIRAGDLTGDGIQVDRADRVPPEVFARAGMKVATAWDSAFTSKGTVGRITLVGPDPAPFVYSPQVCFWRTADPASLSPFVLHAWMRSVHFTAQINAVKGQTDMADYVSLRDQRAMEFRLPTKQEQHGLSLMADPLARLAVAQRAEAQTLAAIRDALLPKLVSGQIRVPLSDDPEEGLGAAVEALDAAPA